MEGIFLVLVTGSIFIQVSCGRTSSVFLTLPLSVGTSNYVAEKLVTSDGNRGKLQVICSKVWAFLI